MFGGSFRFFVNTEAVTSPAPSQFLRKAGRKAMNTSRLLDAKHELQVERRPTGERPVRQRHDES
jgi:hypothetical protein